MRPLWRCRNCGAEWPCPPGRLGLLAEYRGDRIGLLFHLGGLMAEAHAQLTQLNPSALSNCGNASSIGAGPGDDVTSQGSGKGSDWML